MTTTKYIEMERKFEVDPSKLPKLDEPWPTIQAHWNGNGVEKSARLMPSCDIGHYREKSTGFGIRDKKRVETTMEHVLKIMRDNPQARQNVALKYRYHHRAPDGTGWLIDHFPETGHMHAETEFKTPEEFWKGPKTKPDWAGKDITFEPHGYTRHHGKPRSMQEIMQLVALAKKHGCKKKYEPKTLFGGSVPGKKAA